MQEAAPVQDRQPGGESALLCRHLPKATNYMGGGGCRLACSAWHTEQLPVIHWFADAETKTKQWPSRTKPLRSLGFPATDIRLFFGLTRDHPARSPGPYQAPSRSSCGGMTMAATGFPGSYTGVQLFPHGSPPLSDTPVNLCRSSYAAARPREYHANPATFRGYQRPPASPLYYPRAKWRPYPYQLPSPSTHSPSN